MQMQGGKTVIHVNCLFFFFRKKLNILQGETVHRQSIGAQLQNNNRKLEDDRGKQTEEHNERNNKNKTRGQRGRTKTEKQKGNSKKEPTKQIHLRKSIQHQFFY